MEARLDAAVTPARGIAKADVSSAAVQIQDADRASLPPVSDPRVPLDAMEDAVESRLPSEQSTLDESAESAFLAEAANRGEHIKSAAKTEGVEEVNQKPLPPLEQLVARIPVDVRETLDELFRAKFVAVRRMPAKAFKQ